MSRETRVAALRAAIADCRSESVRLLRHQMAGGISDDEVALLDEQLDLNDQLLVDMTGELDVLTDETVVR